MVHVGRGVSLFVCLSVGWVVSVWCSGRLGVWAFEGFCNALGLQINPLLQFPTTIGVQVLGVLALRIAGLGRFSE